MITGGIYNFWIWAQENNTFWLVYKKNSKIASEKFDICLEKNLAQIFRHFFQNSENNWIKY